MSNAEWEHQLKNAIRRVEAMDEIDGTECNDPTAILAAMECGIKQPESGAQFDAYVMMCRLIGILKASG